MHNETLVMDFSEAIEYLVGLGKTRYSIAKALGYKNNTTLCLYQKRSTRYCGPKYALRMLNNYNILVKPYTSRRELEALVEANK